MPTFFETFSVVLVNGDGIVTEAVPEINELKQELSRICQEVEVAQEVVAKECPDLRSLAKESASKEAVWAAERQQLEFDEELYAREARKVEDHLDLEWRELSAVKSSLATEQSGVDALTGKLEILERKLVDVKVR